MEPRYHPYPDFVPDLSSRLTIDIAFDHYSYSHDGVTIDLSPNRQRLVIEGEPELVERVSMAMKPELDRIRAELKAAAPDTVTTRRGRR